MLKLFESYNFKIKKILLPIHSNYVSTFAFKKNVNSANGELDNSIMYPQGFLQRVSSPEISENPSLRGFQSSILLGAKYNTVKFPLKLLTRLPDENNGWLRQKWIFLIYHRARFSALEPPYIINAPLPNQKCIIFSISLFHRTLLAPSHERLF